MGISICKFQLKGWLKQEPKVVHRLDKDRIEYVSTIVKISIPKVTPSKNGICQLGGYHVISVAVHGCAAEQIEKDMADPNLRWHCKDLVEITGYLVSVPHRSSRRKNSLGRQLTSAYRLRTNNRRISSTTAPANGNAQKLSKELNGLPLRSGPQLHPDAKILATNCRSARP